jgi:RNA polymerase sigma-70 factor, ECF subfamily
MVEPRSTTLLRSLIDEHYAFVYRYAYRLSGQAADAEDLTQQTFLQTQSRLHQLREPAAARAWLCAIVRNAYLQSRRRVLSTYPLAETEDAVMELPPVDEIDPEALQGALNELAEEYRTPLILFYFRECSYKEIAAVLDVPLGTVMSRLSRGKAWLRARLAEETSTSESSPLRPGRRPRVAQQT